jgi:hypothetical protein
MMLMDASSGRPSPAGHRDRTPFRSIIRTSPRTFKPLRLARSRRSQDIQSLIQRPVSDGLSMSGLLVCVLAACVVRG